MGRIIPLTILTVVLLLFDWYISGAIKNVYKNWNKQQTRKFNLVWWGTSLVLISAVFLGIFISMNFWIRTCILVLFFIVFVSKFFFIPFLLTDDIRRLIIWIRKIFVKKTTPVAAARKEEHAIPRSEFLVKTGMAVASIPFAALSWGIISGAYDYRVRKQVLKLPNLPRSFHGMKIAQISDVHSGSFYNKKAVLGGIEMLLAQKPDAIFFTGDLVNGKANEMRDYQDIFAKVKAPLGVFSTLGNHDYGMYEAWPSEAAQKQNLQNVIQTHKNMGWDILMNEHRRIKVNNEEIGILGIENWGGGRFPKFGKMEEAVKDTDDLPVKLLLSHDPSHWRAQVLKDYPQIDVSFAGHTHGAQFGVESEYVKWSPVQYIYKEWDGLYQEGKQQLYVNVGYGFLGYPGRIGILPEITIFELQKA